MSVEAVKIKFSTGIYLEGELKVGEKVEDDLVSIVYPRTLSLAELQGEGILLTTKKGMYAIFITDQQERPLTVEDGSHISDLYNGLIDEIQGAYTSNADSIDFTEVFTSASGELYAVLDLLDLTEAFSKASNDLYAVMVFAVEHYEDLFCSKELGKTIMVKVSEDIHLSNKVYNGEDKLTQQLFLCDKIYLRNQDTLVFHKSDLTTDRLSARIALTLDLNYLTSNETVTEAEKTAEYNKKLGLIKAALNVQMALGVVDLTSLIRGLEVYGLHAFVETAGEELGEKYLEEATYYAVKAASKVHLSKVNGGE